MTDAPRRPAVGPRLSTILPSPERPLRTILLAWPFVSLPAILLAAIVSTLFPTAPSPMFPGPALEMFLAVVVIAPVVETIVMAAVLELLVRRVSHLVAILLSAAGWATVHSLQAPTWGLVIWWPFLVFSALYMTWRSRDPDWALLVPMAVHALNNLGPTLLLLRSSGALPI